QMSAASFSNGGGLSSVGQAGDPLENIEEPDLIIEDGVVRAASFPKIIERVSPDADIKTSIEIRDFLLTYRSFATHLDVIQALGERFFSVSSQVVRLKSVFPL